MVVPSRERIQGHLSRVGPESRTFPSKVTRGLHPAPSLTKTFHGSCAAGAPPSARDACRLASLLERSTSPSPCILQYRARVLGNVTLHHVCLLLQDLLQSCSRGGGRRRVEDMCYDRRRAEACVDESAHHASSPPEDTTLKTLFYDLYRLG